jgi:hypothetical protein
MYFGRLGIKFHARKVCVQERNRDVLKNKLEIERHGFFQKSLDCCGLRG